VDDASFVVSELHANAADGSHHQVVQPRHGWQPREGVPALVYHKKVSTHNVLPLYPEHEPDSKLTTSWELPQVLTALPATAEFPLRVTMVITDEYM